MNLKQNPLDSSGTCSLMPLSFISNENGALHAEKTKTGNVVLR